MSSTNEGDNWSKEKTILLVEGAAMVALATALSFVRIIKLPWGGSITLLSMLPIVVFSIRRGIKYGMLASFAFSIIQFVQGIMDGMFGWGLTPTMLIACIFLDYLLAFSVLGIAGLFRKLGSKGWIVGTVLALVLRFACHFASGVVIWKTVGELFPGVTITNPYIYSFLYNGCYMVPEILFTVLGAWAIMKSPVGKLLLSEKTTK